jgi:hypothetical protein
MEEEGVWETCLADPKYEIGTSFPYQIRNQETKNILREYLSNYGYPTVRLSKAHNKHRLIALQFIPNPDDLKEVDHINRIRTDNRIENLRWVSHSENNKNKVSHHRHVYEYFDELPVPCQRFQYYKAHEFEGYSIDEDHNIYVHTGFNFRKLAVLLLRQRDRYYKLVDIEGKSVSVYLSQLDDWI